MPMPPSASDWTRFKKLNAARTYGIPGADGAVDSIGNSDLASVATPPGCTIPSSPYREVRRRDLDIIAGSSKTRREASKWIDFVAAQQADFVTVSEIPRSSGSGFGSFGRQLNRTQLCGKSGNGCQTSVLNTRVGILKAAVYQHSRIV